MIEKFSYEPEIINGELWEKRIKEDSENYLKKISNFSDKRGIKGDELFNLTLDYRGARIAFRSVLTPSGDITKGLFQALCPELESFVTVCEWLGSSESRNQKKLLEYQNIKKYLEENDSSKLCELKGNYRLALNDYSRIITFYASINIIDKFSNFYEWERVPFLKRSSEIFDFYYSPIFMSSMKSNDKLISEEKFSFFTLIFKPIFIMNEFAKFEIFSCTNSSKKEVSCYIMNKELVKKLENDIGKIFLGLFADKIYKKNGYQRELVLFNSSLELDGNEIAGHFVSQKMYYNYLLDRNLFICSNENFEEYCRKTFFFIKKYYNKEVTINLDYFIKLYLSKFFVLIENSWYYKPYIFDELNTEEFIEFLQIINFSDKIKNPSKMIQIMKFNKKYSKFKKYLSFLNEYNYFSKRILINKINKYKNRWEIQ